MAYLYGMIVGGVLAPLVHNAIVRRLLEVWLRESGLSGAAAIWSKVWALFCAAALFVMAIANSRSWLSQPRRFVRIADTADGCQLVALKTKVFSIDCCELNGLPFRPLLNHKIGRKLEQRIQIKHSAAGNDAGSLGSMAR